MLGRVRLAQVAARAVGKSTKILNMTLDYARERRQFGQPIGDFQMVQQMLADSAMEINATRAALWQCAAEIDAGRDPRAKISALKVQGAELLGRTVDRAMQIFGGMGFSKDLPIERYYRDARIYRIFDGASRGASQRHRTRHDERRNRPLRPVGRLMQSKFLSAAEAVALVPDDATLAITGGGGGLCEAMCLQEAIEKSDS